MTDVCPTIGCTDKKLDNDNCGACGTKCMATSSCNASVCGAVPTAVVPAVTGCTALTLALNGTSLFYADEGHGTINKVGTATAVVSGEMAPTWLASAGANLYWYNKGTKAIRTVAAAGGTADDRSTRTPMPAADDQRAPSIGGFLVTPDGTTVYISLGNNVISQALTATLARRVDDRRAPRPTAGIPRPSSRSTARRTSSIPSTFNGDVDAPKLSALPAICGIEDSRAATTSS